LGGGGVDGAITAAGGENLADDRMALKQIAPGIRCKTGSAVITGPGDYGSLKVPFVVHAVVSYIRIT
jgi:O-acetyl-ADP-ribose deacetylase (regulator of RNase III)